MIILKTAVSRIMQCLIGLASFSMVVAANTCDAAQPLPPLELKEPYALEAADPFHRHASILEPVYLLWKNALEPSDDFWIFLEMHRDELQTQYPALYDPYYHMGWLDEEKRHDYEVFLSNGGDDSLHVDTPFGPLSDGKWMYVYMKGRFYVAKEILFRFHHTSLTGGQAVDAAGNFEMTNGILKKISFSSGHYRPTAAYGVQLVHQLVDTGLQLSHFDVSFFVGMDGRTKKAHLPIEQFLMYDPLDDTFTDAQTVPLLPFGELSSITAAVINIFMTADGALFIGPKGWQCDAPELASLGPIIIAVPAKLKEKQIKKIKFNQIANPNLTHETILHFAKVLAENVDNIDRISVVLKNTSKHKLKICDLYRTCFKI